VSLHDIGCLRPAAADDEWNERVAHANLAALWGNYAAAGAERLLLERVLEDRGLLGRIEAAVPGAEIRVALLRAPLAVLRERISVRNASDPTWFLGAAEHLDGVFRTAGVEDFAVDNVDRPPAEVAAELLRRAGWLA
jgi:adenylylsulfate kinase